MINFDETNNGWTCPSGPSAQCRWTGHRVFLRTDAGVQSLRDSYGADIVLMIVQDTGWAGMAYTQRPNCGFTGTFEFTSGCNVGASYENFAYAVLWVGQLNVYQLMP
ncbi:MAG TPA: hypothetical protein VN259_06355, partial [Xanthomonadales bacterium]|nr:hypothetical protein [Xanthomonadales bacterium]